MRHPELWTDAELAGAIEHLDPDPWSLANIRNTDISQMSVMFFELMSRIRALEAEVQALKGGA